MSVAPNLLRRLLFVLIPMVSGGLALRAGMDASWDLRNYHYYNGWTLLTGHIDRDLLVSQVPSFYNPMLDLPFAWAAPRLDARLLAFLLGLLQGGNFILLTLLGETLLSDPAPRRRLLLAASLAACGCLGAVTLSELGTVFYDCITSLGLFASLLILARAWPDLVAGKPVPALLAGLPIGLAFGLKQTMIPYPLGLGVALLLTLPAPLSRRARVVLAFGLGMLIACLAGGGFWMLHLWRHYGNPLFPYLNQLFASPWAQNGDYRDITYEPKSLLQWIVFPWFFSLDSRLASEVEFQDFRILAWFVALPAALLTGIYRRPRAALPLLASFLAYVVWLRLFAIYRYLVALEMLAPLMLALILEGLPHRLRLPGCVILVAFFSLTTRPAVWIRVPFTRHAVEVSLPPIPDPDHTLLLLAGHEPLSFLIPAFPASIRALRIDSTFTNPEQTGVRFNQVMRDAILAHQGPILALFIPSERHDVIKRLGNEDLRLIPDSCQAVTSPIGAADYALCAVAR